MTSIPKDWRVTGDLVEAVGSNRDVQPNKSHISCRIISAVESLELDPQRAD